MSHNNSEWLAIFSYNGNDIIVKVPSLNIITYGNTYDEAYNSTKKIIRSTIDELIKQGKNIPSTDDQNYKREPNQELILITK